MSRSSPTIATKSRLRLSQVLQKAGDLVSVNDVSQTLQMERTSAAKQLARWHLQGLLRRLRRGVYAPVPLTALGQEQVLEDPWVVVPELFGPAYIGGWSAAEHWGLTEQLFRSVCVVTARQVRGKEQTVQGVRFVLKRARAAAMFGMKGVWRGQVKVDVSDPVKTIVDMLDDPALGGGIRHVSDCLDTFLNEAERSAQELIATADRLGNGAVFKRLGFLLERRGGPADAMAACHERLTAGNAKLDPALTCRHLVTRWRLWCPEGWAKSGKE